MESKMAIFTKGADLAGICIATRVTHFRKVKPALQFLGK
jgi:hypothetical protein